ncbi:hypothetical protein BT69DRAFT_1205688, partial [Atractiella rhizophila]
FDDDHATAFETLSLDGKLIRGQITLYNTIIQARQFRTRVFSFFVHGDTCRLIRHSRACAEVSISFSLEDTGHLQEFLWRF